MDLEVIDAFKQVMSRRDLTRDQTRRVFACIADGDMPENATAALLGALAAKGECVDELVGASEAMRERAVPIKCTGECIDTCGAGGDGISTFNVSTTAAVIAAASGATVAKHGNRSNTRASGSTEVLTQLGVDVDADTEVVERCLVNVQIGYLNARMLHPAMRHAASVRQAIPTRTIFNLLGPLTNPAGPRRQIVGVPRSELAELMAQALGELGATHVWVVHGGDGLCDLTITASTSVVEVRDGTLRRFSVTPEEVGLSRGALDDLRVESPEASADKVCEILEGVAGAPRDHALMNAGAALVVAGLAGDLSEGVERASRAIDDGAALETLTRWRELTSAHGRAEAGGD